MYQNRFAARERTRRRNALLIAIIVHGLLLAGLAWSSRGNWPGSHQEDTPAAVVATHPKP